MIMAYVIVIVIDIFVLRKSVAQLVMPLLSWFYRKLTIAQVDAQYIYDNYGLW